nr:MAG TPA: hypothetical protein [Microviridae sp.]
MVYHRARKYPFLREGSSLAYICQMWKQRLREVPHRFSQSHNKNL